MPQDHRSFMAVAGEALVSLALEALAVTAVVALVHSQIAALVELSQWLAHRILAAAAVAVLMPIRRPALLVVLAL